MTTGQARWDGPRTPAGYAASKVPLITAYFWIIKLLSTAMGEATSDYMVRAMNPVIAVLLGAAAWAVAMALQFRAKQYNAWIYWLAVVMVAVFGTMCADVLHIKFHVPYLASTLFYAIVLAAIFVLWYRSEGTLSIHSIRTPRREFFYWATVLATFALGTATGDMTARTLNLGYLASGFLFTFVFAAVAVAHWKFGLNPILAFWIAYVLTRPIGASFADYVAFPRSVGGLDVGHATVALVLTFFIVCLVGYMASTRKDVEEPDAAYSRAAATRHRYAPEGPGEYRSTPGYHEVPPPGRGPVEPQPYDRQSYDQPGYQPAAYDQRSYQPPSYDPRSPYDQRSYEPQSYDQRSYEPPSPGRHSPPDQRSYEPRPYDQASHDPRSYEPPGYDQRPSPGQRSYEPPGYDQQPSSGQRSYDQPSYEPRSYDQRPPDRPSYDPRARERASYDPRARERASYDPGAQERRPYDQRPEQRPSYDPRPGERGPYDQPSPGPRSYDSRSYEPRPADRRPAEPRPAEPRQRWEDVGSDEDPAEQTREGFFMWDDQ
jgi:uncharacterized membrane-anchored protein